MPVDPDHYVDVHSGVLATGGGTPSEGDPQDDFNNPDNSGLGLILGVY